MDSVFISLPAFNCFRVMQRDRIGYYTFCLIWDGRPAKLVTRSYTVLYGGLLRLEFRLVVVIYTLIALIVIDSSIIQVQLA